MKALALIVLLSGCLTSWAGETSSAALLKEARALMAESERLMLTDMAAAARLAEAALGKAEVIVRERPTSEEAVKLLNGKRKIGNLPLDALRYRVKDLKSAADATESPLKLVLWLVSRAQTEDYRSQMLGVFCKVLAESGYFEEAMDLTGRIEKEHERRTSLGIIVYHGLNLSDESRKQKILARAISIAEQSLSDWQKKHALAEIKGIIEESSRLDKESPPTGEAMPPAEFSTQIHKASQLLPLSARAEEFIRIAYALGDKKRAARCLSQAQEAANRIPEAELRAELLVKIAQGFLSVVDNKQSIKCYSLALDAAERVPDEEHRFWALFNVIGSMTRTECLLELATLARRAFKSADRIQDEGNKWRAMSELAPLLARTGCYEEALEAVSVVNVAGWRENDIFYSVIEMPSAKPASRSGKFTVVFSDAERKAANKVVASVLQW